MRRPRPTLGSWQIAGGKGNERYFRKISEKSQNFPKTFFPSASMSLIDALHSKALGKKQGFILYTRKEASVEDLLKKRDKYPTTEDHPNERRMLMFWWIIDDFLDGDWQSLLCVVMLMILALVVGLLI